MLQGGAHTFEKLGPGDGALNIPEGFAEIIGEGSVVSAADEGIGGCLGVFAAGEKHMSLGIVRSADLLKFQIVFIHLPAENINGRDQKPLFDGMFPRQASQGSSFASSCPGMAGIQQHFQVNAGRQL